MLLGDSSTQKCPPGLQAHLVTQEPFLLASGGFKTFSLNTAFCKCSVCESVEPKGDPEATSQPQHTCRHPCASQTFWKALG